MSTLHKLFGITVLISFAAHIVVLSVPVAFRTLAATRYDEHFVNVDLKRSEVPVPDPRPKKEEARDASPSRKNPPSQEDAAREETVSLDNEGVKYRDYLRKIKKRIEKRWIYPPQAFERGENGIASIRFTIDADGSLAAVVVTETSGYNLLDQATLDVIRASAPYDPLPRAFNLSRLHVLASFHYKLGP